jgi:DNA-binding transcriptional MerR regulator
MIRIGDFSKLSRVSVKALRYYDEMGLLKPVAVDRFTGYRLYEYSQLSVLNRILALKELGFSLGEIGRLLDDGLTVEQMRGMLKLRETEARARVREETERLERVEAHLRQIEQENSMSKYDVVIKNVEAIKFASVRDVVPTPPEQGPLWEELGGIWLSIASARVGFVLRYTTTKISKNTIGTWRSVNRSTRLCPSQNGSRCIAFRKHPWLAPFTTVRLQRSTKPIMPSANGWMQMDIALSVHAARCISNPRITAAKPMPAQ